MTEERRKWLSRHEELAQKIDWEPHQELLLLSVSVAVPLEIANLQRLGGPHDYQWEWARKFADELGAHGDILQFKGGRKGETAAIFNGFAYCLAIMAFLPGGVKFGGLHFEAVTDNDD